MTETITISRTEYEALLADRELLADVRTYDQAKARLGSGDEELLPSEFVDRALSGDSLLKLWREYRSLTKTALSRASGVNRVQIADIEAGRKTGSVATLRRLADALGISVDDLA